MLNQALRFLLDTAFSLITYALLLRFMMQWLRAPFRNPLGQAVMALTDWAVKPVRRVLPSYKGLDAPTLVLVWTVGKEVVDRRKTRRERTKVFVGMHAALARAPDGNIGFVVVLDVSNLGRESVIITAARAEGEGSKMSAGMNKEPDAAYGVRDRLLPSKIEPGQTAELQLFGPGIFRTAWKRVYVEDADDKQYEVSLATFERVKSQYEQYSAGQAEA